jgi:hypothetical protein
MNSINENDESKKGKIVVGYIQSDNSIYASEEVAGHDELFDLYSLTPSDIYKNSWRFNKEKKILFFWDLPEEDKIERVKSYLKRKNYTVNSVESLRDYTGDDFKLAMYLSHGDAYDGYPKPKKPAKLKSYTFDPNEPSIAEYTDYYKHLNESWKNYKISNSPKILLFDFYVASYLSTLPLGSEQKGFSGNLIGRDASEVKLDIEHALSVLLPVLVKKLKNALFLSICAEIRHLFDNEQNYTSYKDNRLLKYYSRYYRLETGGPPEFKLNRDVKNPRVKPTNKLYLASYKAAMMAIKKTGSSTAAFAELAGDLFINMEWNNSYGGSKWAEIVDGYLLLDKASTNNQKQVAIDHAYDLQHNTGTALNKVNDFRVDGSFDWIQKALDLKRDVKSMYELLPHCSSDMRKLALEAFKIANVKKPSELQTKNSEPAPEKQNGEINVTPGQIYNVEKYGCLFRVYSVDVAEYPYKGIATGKIVFIHDLHLFNRLNALSSKKLDVDVETAIHTNFLYDLTVPNSFFAKDNTGNLLQVGNEYSYSSNGVEGTLVKIDQQKIGELNLIELKITKITDKRLQQAYLPNIKIGDYVKGYNDLKPINKNAAETDKSTQKFKKGDIVSAENGLVKGVITRIDNALDEFYLVKMTEVDPKVNLTKKYEFEYLEVGKENSYWPEDLTLIKSAETDKSTQKFKIGDDVLYDSPWYKCEAIVTQLEPNNITQNKFVKIKITKIIQDVNNENPIWKVGDAFWADENKLSILI